MFAKPAIRTEAKSVSITRTLFMFPALYVHFLIVAKIGMHNGIEKNLAYLAGIWQIKPDNKKCPLP